MVHTSVQQFITGNSKPASYKFYIVTEDDFQSNRHHFVALWRRKVLFRCTVYQRPPLCCILHFISPCFPQHHCWTLSEENTGGEEGKTVPARIDISELMREAPLFQRMMLNGTAALYAQVETEKGGRAEAEAARTLRAAAARVRQVAAAARRAAAVRRGEAAPRPLLPAGGRVAAKKIRQPVVASKLAEAVEIGLTSRLWQMVGEYMERHCPQWALLAELAMVVVPGSVEDERTFSGLNFIHSPQRSCLVNPHLTDSLRMFLSKTWDVGNFPYNQALVHWHNAASIRGRYHK